MLEDDLDAATETGRPQHVDDVEPALARSPPASTGSVTSPGAARMLVFAFADPFASVVGGAAPAPSQPATGEIGVTSNASRWKRPGASIGSKRNARAGCGKRSTSSVSSVSQTQASSRSRLPAQPEPSSAKKATCPGTSLVIFRRTRYEPAGSVQGTMKYGSDPVTIQWPDPFSGSRSSCCQGMRAPASNPRGRAS